MSASRSFFQQLLLDLNSRLDSRVDSLALLALALQDILKRYSSSFRTFILLVIRDRQYGIWTKYLLFIKILHQIMTFQRRDDPRCCHYCSILFPWLASSALQSDEVSCGSGLDSVQEIKRKLF